MRECCVAALDVLNASKEQFRLRLAADNALHQSQQSHPDDEWQALATYMDAALAHATCQGAIGAFPQLASALLLSLPRRVRECHQAHLAKRHSPK